MPALGGWGGGWVGRGRAGPGRGGVGRWGEESSGVQGQPGLLCEFKGSRNCVERLVSKKKKKEKKTK